MPDFQAHHDDDRPTMLSETLQRLHAARLIDVPRVAESACLAASTIYHWIAGDCDPSVTGFCRMFRALPPEAQHALLAMLCAGTAWECCRVTGDLDANGDGRINLTDALQTHARAARDAADSVHRLAVAVIEHDLLHLDAMHTMRAQAGDAAGALLTASCILGRIIEERSTRHRARTIGGMR